MLSSESLNRLKKVKVFGIDLDGVVWQGSEMLDRANDAIKVLNEYGTVVFLTNNSAKKKSSIIEKLSQFQIECKTDHLFTSGYEAISLCERKKFNHVYVVGPDEIINEYKIKKFNVLNQNDSITADAVIIHYFNDFKYSDITHSMNHLNKGAELIGCNRERAFPVNHGNLLPGCGPILASIEFATKKNAQICGKPEASFLLSCFKTLEVTADEFIMIGDSFESDILMANNAKSLSVHINSNSSELTNVQNISADFSFKSLYEFSNFLKKEIKQ